MERRLDEASRPTAGERRRRTCATMLRDVGGQAARPARRAAARRRRADPRPAGVRLPGAGRARAVRRARRAAPAARCSTSSSPGMSDAIRSMTPGGPRREPRDGPRPQRAPPRADRRRRPGRVASSSPSTAGSSRAPRRFDDIIEQLAQRMAAMQSLLRSMSPEQRAELQSMMDALLRDDRLLVDLAQLASNLDQLLPGGLGDRVPFGGDEPLGLEGALAQIAPAAGDGPARGRPGGRRVARRPRRHRPRRGPRPARRRRPSATSTRSTTSRGGSRRPAT